MSGGEQHRLEIVRLPLQRTGRDVRAQRHGSDIARPGIRADQIWFTTAADAKAPGLDRRETEMAVRANDPQRMICRTSVLDRCRHRQLSSSQSLVTNAPSPGELLPAGGVVLTLVGIRIGCHLLFEYR